jgi:spore germination protein KB
MNQIEGHIGPLAGVVLLYAVLAAQLFVQFPSYLIEAGGPAAWQSSLILTAGALLLFLPTALLARRFPGQGLAQISETVAGPMIGSLLTLGVAAWFFALLTNGLRNFSETFIVSFLPFTPPSMVILVLLLSAIYASYRGVETLSRAALILLPLIVAGGLLVLLFSIPRFEGSHLFPFWGHSFAQTASAGLLFAGGTAEVVLLLVVGYAFRQPQGLMRSGLIGLVLFGITLTATVLVLVVVFGGPGAAEQPFPMFNLTRLIYLGRFFQRIEAIIVMFWVVAVAVRLTALLHGTVIALSGALRLPYFRPLLFPVGVISFSLSLLPENMLAVLRIDRDWLQPLGLAVFGVPFFLLLLALLRNKRGEKIDAAS